MAYLVRKLNKRTSIDLIANAESAEDMFADAATAEFRTSKGTLSTWIIDDIVDLDDAVLAIVVTSTHVDRMDFIVIDTRLIEENNLKYVQSYAGREIAIPDLQDSHYDIVDITIPKLIDCTCVYRKVIEQDNDEGNFIVRYAEGDIRDLLKKAINDGRIEIDLLTKDVRDCIQIM